MIVALTSCAAGPNTLKNSENADGEVVKFWRGIWHGFIAPFAFIISLFNDNVGIYEVHNNGGWYNFGFMIGLSIIFGGPSGGRGAYKKRRSRKE
jgi:hypothetical protein